MDRTTFIYSLNCPITGAPRYIGKSDCPDKRFLAHLCDQSQTRKSRWIQSLVLAGLLPYLQVLREVPASEWESHEREIISSLRVTGFDLTNGTDGGEGQSPGYAPSEETRNKIRSARLGASLSSEGRKKVGDAHRGKPLSPEHREKLRRSHLGIPLSLEHAKNKGLAQMGLKRSGITLEKMKASQKQAWLRRKEKTHV